MSKTYVISVRLCRFCEDTVFTVVPSFSTLIYNLLGRNMVIATHNSCI